MLGVLVVGLGGLLIWYWTRQGQPDDLRFGVTITRGNVAPTHGGVADFYATRAQEAGVRWVRFDGPRWSEVEPQPPVRNADGSWSHSYDWSAFERTDRELAALRRQGLTPVVILQGTPAWAVDPGAVAKMGRGEEFDRRCLPINPDPEVAGLEHFAAYARLMVERYKGRSYQVNHWEIWNEPDAAMQLVPASAGAVGWGCWGDRDDPFYGGEAFGRLLRVVYPAIKAEDPDASVYHGGLLLGSDDDPGGTGGRVALRTGMFLAGTLRAVYPDGADGSDGGATETPPFDGVAFHSYAYWWNRADLGGHVRDWNLFQFGEQGWQANPESLPEKARYIRDILESYGADVPIWVNEGAFLCVENAPCHQPPLHAIFLEDQANYLVRYYVRAWAHQLAGAVWYPLNPNGWRQADLFNGDHTPRPAYQTLSFLGHHLATATYVETLATGTVEGHRFRRGSTEYLVYWTNDSAETRQIERPNGTTHVYIGAGLVTTLPLDASTIPVGFEPIVIVRVVDR